MSFVRIHLDRNELEPGSELTGTVEWDTVNQQPDLLLISLLWYTEGKGTEDSATVDQQEIPSPMISGRQAFSFRLPREPWSFSGTLISLIWAVEAKLEGTGLFESASFISAPEGREVRLSSLDEE